MHCLNYNFNNDSSHEVTFPGDSVEPTAELSNDEIGVIMHERWDTNVTSSNRGQTELFLRNSSQESNA